VVSPLGYLEQRNGTLRDRLGCLTRKTHAFAHNWLRPHIALRMGLAERADGRRSDQRTPAIAFGLAGHIWTWIEF
jgi:hypothetical protein